MARHGSVFGGGGRSLGAGRRNARTTGNKSGPPIYLQYEFSTGRRCAKRLGSTLVALCWFKAMVLKVRVEKGELAGVTRKGGFQVVGRIIVDGRKLTSDEIASLVPLVRQSEARKAASTAGILARLDADLERIGGAT